MKLTPTQRVVEATVTQYLAYEDRDGKPTSYVPANLARQLAAELEAAERQLAEKDKRIAELESQLSRSREDYYMLRETNTPGELE